MSFSVEWENAERTVIRMTVPETFTWEEYNAANDRYYELHGAVEHDVCTILDIRALKKVPQNTLVQFPKLAQHFPQNSALMVAVGGAGFLAQLARIFSKVYGKMQVVSTMEEALAIIEKKQHT